MLHHSHIGKRITRHCHRKHSFADEYEQFLKHYQDTLKNKVDKVGDD